MKISITNVSEHKDKQGGGVHIHYGIRHIAESECTHNLKLLNMKPLKAVTMLAGC